MAMFLAGLTTGIILIVLLIRRLGKASRKSLLWTEVFHKITGYKAATYIIDRSIRNVIVKVSGNDDDTNMLEALAELGFPKGKALDAIKHVKNIIQNAPLQDKLTEALRYLDNGSNAHDNKQRN